VKAEVARATCDGVGTEERSTERSTNTSIETVGIQQGDLAEQGGSATVRSPYVPQCDDPAFVRVLSSEEHGD